LVGGGEEGNKEGLAVTPSVEGGGCGAHHWWCLKAAPPWAVPYCLDIWLKVVVPF
jgi:hypothetical protein